MSEPVTFRLDGLLRWDDERGELQTLVDGTVREVIEVRAALLDDVLLASVILELTRRGYVVTPPETVGPAGHTAEHPGNTERGHRP